MWLIIFGLFASTVSGVVTGPWLIAFVLLALAAPALTLRSPRPVGVTTTSRERPGAEATYVNGRIRDPAHAAP
jgi:hypothetical protein